MESCMTANEMVILAKEVISRVSVNRYFDYESRQAISRLAKRAVDSVLYKLFERDGMQFWKDATWNTDDAMKVFDFLVGRLNDCPSEAHELGMILLIMPKLNELVMK